MSKYKVGDRVKILDGSNIRDYRCLWYDEGMKEFVGTTGVINYIVEPLGTECTGYRLKGSPYTWDERGLELAESKARDGENLKPPHPRWTPGESEDWFAIGTHGSIRHFTEGINSDSFECCNDVANVYRSEDDAVFALERRKVLAEIDEWRGEYGDPVSIAYYENDGKVESIAALYPNRGEALFANYEDADGCIRAIGQKRLKKYYFMIPEEEKTDDER